MTSTEPGRTAASHQERDVPVRGSRVRVLHAGSGPPLLYLHSAGDPGLWMPVLAELATRYTVYRPDHPGFNASEDRPEIGSVHDLAFFYLDLLDELGLDQVVLIGSSLGGWLAADLATIEPRRVSKLVLAGAAGLRAEGTVPDVFQLSPVELAELTYHTSGARSAAVAEAERVEQDAERFGQYLRNRSATAHLGWNPYLHDPALPHRLHRIAAPALIMWGAHDRLLPAGCARRWAELLPSAQLTIIEDAGHHPLAEQPDAALEALWPFLRKER